MNETAMLELGAALADLGVEIEALFGPDTSYPVTVDGQLVDGPESTLPVTAPSRIVLYRRHGPMLDVLNRGVVRRICLN